MKKAGRLCAKEFWKELVPKYYRPAVLIAEKAQRMILNQIKDSRDMQIAAINTMKGPESIEARIENAHAAWKLESPDGSLSDLEDADSDDDETDSGVED